MEWTYKIVCPASPNENSTRVDEKLIYMHTQQKDLNRWIIQMKNVKKSNGRRKKD